MRLENAYHGDTIGAVSIGGIDRFHETYRPLLFATASIPSPYCYRCPLGLTYPSCELACADALDEVLTREGDTVAAVVVEPLVQGAAGIITAPDGHLRRVADIARRHGVLLVVDEVATGFGRTGTMFACEHEGVEPDLLCLAKGLTGGYLPLSATLATSAVFDAFLARPEEHRTLYHGHSYSGNPLCCAAALANLDVFEAEGTLAALPGKVAALAGLLAPLADHPHVGEVRQRGLMVGIELVADKETKDPFPEHLQVGAEVARAARPRGAVVRPLGDVVVLMPPLAMTEPELARLVQATAEAIDEATTAALGPRPFICDRRVAANERRSRPEAPVTAQPRPAFHFATDGWSNERRSPARGAGWPTFGVHLRRTGCERRSRAPVTTDRRSFWTDGWTQ